MPQAEQQPLEFASDSPAGEDQREPWLVLVVDDDAEIQAVTRLALSEFEFDGRPVRTLAAASGAQAREVLAKNPEVAVILLDVVMETEQAGLDFARYVREDLNNRAVRIALRTGQPDQAPPREIVTRYEIDDYRAKTELTFDRLHILIMTALRTFRLLQRMEQHQRALTESNQDLERFAYVASHDLQTPVRGIVSMSQLLLQRYGSTLDAEAQQLLNLVARGARDMHAMILDLLQYSRLGRTDTTLETLDLGKVIDKACAGLQPVFAERKAAITYDGLPTIEGNASQLGQLFRNLIENAIKFQPGPHPSVSISADASGSGWEIRVADKGIGIETQFLDKIFEVFRRLHTAEQFPGTGIGLAICKKVVQLHGGSIHAESTPGKGTTLVIRLPATQKRN